MIQKNQVVGEGVVTIIDISRTGIAFSTNTPVETGLKIELAIGVGDEIVKTLGRIRNQNPPIKKVFRLALNLIFYRMMIWIKLATVYPDISK